MLSVKDDKARRKTHYGANLGATIENHGKEAFTHHIDANKGKKSNLKDQHSSSKRKRSRSSKRTLKSKTNNGIAFYLADR